MEQNVEKRRASVEEAVAPSREEALAVLAAADSRKRTRQEGRRDSRDGDPGYTPMGDS